MNTNLKKINKYCHISSIILNILKIITILSFVTVVIGGILSACFSDKLNIAYANHSFSLPVNLSIPCSFVSFNINEVAQIHDGNIALALGAGCILIAISLLFFFIVLNLFIRILKEIKKEASPFTSVIIKTLHTTFIVLSILLFILFGIIYAAIGTLLFFIIYTIFEYGYVLQLQVDETL
ncbi:MAG: hypothetical protein K2N51_12965 [Lachnospiraceae bacterium]|nr:hypothetical protein [Lachnospiraceae bacterium]